MGNSLSSTVDTLHECNHQDRLRIFRELHRKNKREWNREATDIGFILRIGCDSSKPRNTKNHEHNLANRIERGEIQKWKENPSAFWTGPEYSGFLKDKLSSIYTAFKKLEIAESRNSTQQRFLKLFFSDLIDQFVVWESSAKNLKPGRSERISKPQLSMLASMINQDSNNSDSHKVIGDLDRWVCAGRRWRLLATEGGIGILFTLSKDWSNWVEKRMPIKGGPTLKVMLTEIETPGDSLNELGDILREDMLEPYRDKVRFQPYMSVLDPTMITSKRKRRTNPPFHGTNPQRKRRKTTKPLDDRSLAENVELETESSDCVHSDIITPQLHLPQQPTSSNVTPCTTENPFLGDDQLWLGESADNSQDFVGDQLWLRESADNSQDFVGDQLWLRESADNSQDFVGDQLWLRESADNGQDFVGDQLWIRESIDNDRQIADTLLSLQLYQWSNS